MLNVDEDDETHEKKMKQGVVAAAEQREEMRLQHKTARYFL